MSIGQGMCGGCFSAPLNIFPIPVPGHEKIFFPISIPTHLHGKSEIYKFFDQNMTLIFSYFLKDIYVAYLKIKNKKTSYINNKQMQKQLH